MPQNSTVGTGVKRYLKVEISPRVYRRFLIDKDLTIGRSDDNDVILPDLSISNHHSMIGKDNDKIWIEDLGSTNGTLVNDIIIHKRYLDHNDLITIGYIKMLYSVEASSDCIIDFTSDPNFSPSKHAIDHKDVFFILPSNQIQIRNISKILENKIANLPMPSSEKKLLLLAIMEALGNAHRHGNHSDPNKRLFCRFRIDTEQVIVDIADEGEGFSYFEWFQNISNEPELPDKGLAIFLRGADIVEYSLKGNHVFLTKRFYSLATKEEKKTRSFLNQLKYLAIRYSDLVIEKKNFLLEVVVSSENIKNYPNIMPLKTSSILQSDKINLFVLLPVYPGCLCVPSFREIDMNQTPNKVEFWITALGQGETKNSCLHLLKEGKIVEIIPTPIQVIDTKISKILLVLSVIIPFFFILLDIPEIRVNKEVPTIVFNIYAWIKNWGGFSILGILIGLVCMILGILLHLRIYQAKPHIIHKVI